MKKPQFKFTDDQKKELLLSWKTKSGQSKAEAFLDSIQSAVGEYIEPFLPAAMTSTDLKEVHDEIRTLAKDLRGRLLSLQGRERWGLEAVFDLTAKSWGMPCHSTDFYSDLVQRLELTEAVCQHKLEHWGPVKAGPAKGAETVLLMRLISIHKRHFGKFPSTSSNGAFMQFLSELSVIIGTPLGSDLLKTVLRDFSF
jgi:hypothetical protein